MHISVMKIPVPMLAYEHVYRDVHLPQDHKRQGEKLQQRRMTVYKRFGCADRFYVAMGTPRLSFPIK